MECFACIFSKLRIFFFVDLHFTQQQKFIWLEMLLYPFIYNFAEQLLFHIKMLYIMLINLYFPYRLHFSGRTK